MGRGRVFLIDDHDAVLEMLSRVMHDLGVDVVGVARSGTEAIPQILASMPDLVLLDLSMPDQSGFDIVTELRASSVACRFLVFTGVASSYVIERIGEMRFDGVVSKMSSIQELMDATQAVLSGKTYVCKLFTDIRLEHINRANHPSRMLTPREVQVLALIGEAKSDEEIANAIKLSATTVQGYRTKLINKLRLYGTPQLVRFANQHGYTEFRKTPTTGA